MRVGVNALTNIVTDRQMDMDKINMSPNNHKYIMIKAWLAS